MLANPVKAPRVETRLFSLKRVILIKHCLLASVCTDVRNQMILCALESPSHASDFSILCLQIYGELRAFLHLSLLEKANYGEQVVF